MDYNLIYWRQLHRKNLLKKLYISRIIVVKFTAFTVTCHMSKIQFDELTMKNYSFPHSTCIYNLKIRTSLNKSHAYKTRRVIGQLAKNMLVSGL